MDQIRDIFTVNLKKERMVSKLTESDCNFNVLTFHSEGRGVIQLNVEKGIHGGQ